MRILARKKYWKLLKKRNFNKSPKECLTVKKVKRKLNFFIVLFS